MTAIPPPTDAFQTACSDFGLELAFDELARHADFLRLLYDTNATTNLTAIRDPAEAWLKHTFDALTLLPALEQASPAEDRLSLCDVGAGGGVPGIPLAIARPDIDITLLEATGRKCDFLRAAAETLGLANLRIVQGRAETVGGFPAGELRDRFDAVCARALGRVSVAAELCVPLARERGLVLLIKGQKADEELAEAKRALHMLHVAHAGTIDTPTGKIVVLEKSRRTPRVYPRRDGEPKRAPLGVSRGS
ncbi:MAG: 16S rRNA (guanine(527)-N(7))-methyltransferase RsmG [Planctomycetota bacterium]